MTDRMKRFAEITMAHIYTWTDDKKETTHIKFGAAALRSAVNMIDDSVRIVEYNQVLDQLVADKFLKKIGRHMYGLGTGKGLKRYKVNDESLLARPADKGWNNSKAKHLIDNAEAAPTVAKSNNKPGPKPKVSGGTTPADKPTAPTPEKDSTADIASVHIAAAEEQAAKDISDVEKQTEDAITELDKHQNRVAAEKELADAVLETLGDAIGVSTTKDHGSSIDDHQLEQELLDIHKTLNASPVIGNADQKLKTLERLRLIFKDKSPGTAQVLETIINDYAELQQGEAA